MKIPVTLNGVEHVVEFDRSGAACRFSIDSGQERSADVVEAEPSVYSVLSGGRTYDAHVEETPSGLLVVIDGHRFEIEVRDPRRWTAAARGGLAQGRVNVVAPMPGKIVRLLVTPGDTIQAGEGILVVEAMKMQNEMKAPKSGRVVSISAQEGATVNAGEVLAAIE
jgi:biotin carboxyl carrier protein